MRTRLVVVLAVTVVFLVVALWGLDLDKAGVALANTDWLALLPMFGLYLVAHCLRALRLGVLLQAGVPFRRLFAITTIGFLAINVIPLRLGEMVRPYLLAEREGVPLGRGLAAIVVERLLDMCMLLLMLLGVTFVVELPVGGVVVQGVDVIQAGQRAAGTLVALGCAGGLVLVVAGEPVLRLLARLPAGGRIAGLARRFREALIELVHAPLRAVGLLLMSMGIWALTILAVSVVMRAFPGVPGGLDAALATWAITLSGMTAVPTPGFFGAYELFCSAALWLFAVEADLARTFAVVLHLSQFGFTVSLGLLFLLLEGLSLRDLVRPAGSEPPPSGPAGDAASQ